MQELFQRCCQITAVFAKLLNMTYGEFNILAFLYIQPLTYIVSFFILRKTLYGKIGLLISIIYQIYLALNYPISDVGFVKAFNDLHLYANYLNISYVEINLILFIVVFIIIHIINIFIFVNKNHN